LSREQSTALFRILQEALTNVARHARAATVQVSLVRQAGWLTLSVSDDGRGITAAEVEDRRSLGLLGILERARLLGGEARITGAPERGTTVQVRIPSGDPAGEPGTG